MYNKKPEFMSLEDKTDFYFYFTFTTPVGANNSADSVRAPRTCIQHTENTQGAGE